MGGAAVWRQDRGVGRGFSQEAGWEAEDQKSKGQDLAREAGLQP